MALIKYAALAQEISGSVGGATFARVHDAKIIRGWRAPANKRTPGQLTLRHLLPRFSGIWKNNETQPCRDGWDIYAPTCTFFNSLGDDYTISGFNMYVRNLTAITYFAADIQTDPPWFLYPPPPSSGFPPIYSPTITFTHATGVLTLTQTFPDPNPTHWLCFIIHNYMSASRRFPKRQTIGHTGLDLAYALPQTIFTYPTAPPGAAGSVRAVLSMRTSDGENRVSTPQFITIPST